ncbi:U6 snRNA-associated Sm-like protein LSm1 [Pseudoscourfieldia marina]
MAMESRAYNNVPPPFPATANTDISPDTGVMLERMPPPPGPPVDPPPPGSALVDEVDKRILVVLRDGRKILGILRSFDQFSNMVLVDACERVIVGDTFGDVPLGSYIVRGENLVLLGAVDEAESEAGPPGLRRLSADEIRVAEMAEKQSNSLKRTMLARFDFLDDLS